MPDTVRGEEQTRHGTFEDVLSSLGSETQALVRNLVERAATLEKAGRKVDELALFHQGQEADLMLGIKVQRNSATGEIPNIDELSEDKSTTALPQGFAKIGRSFEEVIKRRRSLRDYTDEAIGLEQLAHMLHLGFGVRGRIRAYGKKRLPTFHAPTGGGLQSTRILVLAHNVDGLKRGIYEFRPDGHTLHELSQGEIRWKMYELCAFQDWIAHAAGVIALVTDLKRVKWKYEERSYRLAHLDAGVIGQNLHLAATALDIASCLVFGYVDEDMNRFLGLKGGAEEFTSLLMPFGRSVPRYNLLSRDSGYHTTSLLDRSEKEAAVIDIK